MKNTILNKVSAFGACVLLAASCLSAQSGPRVTANVPFDFMVRNQHLAAGPYTMIIDLNQGSVLIRGAEDSLFTLTHSTARSSAGDLGAKLVFNRYGDRYFLSEVWSVGNNEGREFPRCRAELELARSGAKPEVVALLITPGRPHTPAR